MTRLRSRYLPVTDSLWRSVDTGLISIARVVDPLAGEVLHVGAPETLVVKRISALVVIGQFIIGGLWFLMMVSAFLFALVWSVRFWRGSLSTGMGIRVRLWPLIASLLFVAAFVAMGLTLTGPREALVGPTIPSVSFMLLTTAFAAASVWSVLVVVRARNAAMNAVAYWHSAALAGLHLIVTSIGDNLRNSSQSQVDLEGVNKRIGRLFSASRPSF